MLRGVKPCDKQFPDYIRFKSEARAKAHFGLV
jgi:hypothetical protein